MREGKASNCGAGVPPAFMRGGLEVIGVRGVALPRDLLLQLVPIRHSHRPLSPYAVSLEDIERPFHFLHLSPVAQASRLQSVDAGETPALLLVAAQKLRQAPFVP
jgi:hypothetical protein